MVRKTLEKHGYSVIVASDAISGLKRVEEEAPDLVLTDLAMPIKDGFSLIHELRASGYQKPILATSGGMGTSPIDFLQAAKEAGANETLAKPFSLTELVTKVSGLLSA